MRIQKAKGADGVESNARLTGGVAALLLVLLAAEGVTLLSIHQLITLHVFIGMLLVPPVLLKVGSTGWRFVRYYRGSPPYRHKGPPPMVLRLLGPAVVILTAILFVSGIVLVFTHQSGHSQLLFIHKASFVLWFAAMVIHVLGHIVETARLAPLDWMRRTRREIAHAGARTWAITVSVIAGVLLGVATWGHTGGFAHLGR